jgi:hypothetical protein
MATDTLTIGVIVMPTIRVDDDVFEGLKALAEPFTDTPNTVIKRLLLERGQLQRSRSERSPVPARPQAPKATGPVRAGVLTPQPVYEAFLLHVLGTKFNGVADKAGATRSVIALMKRHGYIDAVDEELVQTGETKAANTIAWGRNALKERGLISRNSRRGSWELTPEGLAESRKVILPHHD